ncbi:MAG: hypothetical protein FJ271_00215 [Planctomycetes bacterium]|nr:hypothetical protein [Planctomycetota bacterium]
MIEFATVTREFRSLIRRRQHLMTFLGSLFAATGLFLHNVLKGDIPRDLENIKEYVFAFYAVMVLVPTSLLALRLARLHGGLVINGVFYAQLMQGQDFTRKPDVNRAARHNPLGVSFLQFLLTALLAGFAGVILGLGLDLPLWAAVGLGGAVLAALLLLYFRYHRQAVALAFKKIAEDTCGPVERKEWRDHVSNSLEDANQGLLHELSFVGLIMFSMFEKIAGLKKISRDFAGPAYDDILFYGPWVYSLLMMVTCLFGLLVYLRIRVAIGTLSLQLDPNDRPFRPLRMTDSLLGYLLLAFLFAVSLHMVLIVLVPQLHQQRVLLVAIDAAALGLAVLAEQLTLVVAGRKNS